MILKHHFVWLRHIVIRVDVFLAVRVDYFAIFIMVGPLDLNCTLVESHFGKTELWFIVTWAPLLLLPFTHEFQVGDLTGRRNLCNGRVLLRYGDVRVDSSSEVWLGRLLAFGTLAEGPSRSVYSRLSPRFISGS